MRFAFLMIMRWTFYLLLPLLSSSVIPATGFGQDHRRDQSGWRATVECDSMAVYSQMSIQSRAVAHLTKGDIVTIDLEFISAGGAWCSVAEPGKKVRLGYARSECLDREQMESFAAWEAQSPPTQPKPNTEPAQRADRTTETRATREEIEQEVDRVVASKLRALELANETPVQMAQREPFGFDDRTSFLFLPKFGVPFNFFRHMVPRLIPSVQIRPGHFLRRR